MKQYNCPDCQLNVTDCTGCPRVKNIQTNVFDQNTYKNYLKTTIPNACKSCPNHPSNGGDGICNCILGIMDFYKNLSGTI